MGQDNFITVVGNLTRDPEQKTLGSGATLATFGVAVNRRWLNRSTNEWDEQVSFFDVTCWNELAENVATSLTRGMRVVVSGRLEQRSWETENGEKRSKVEIRADEVGPSLRWARAEVSRTERSGNFAQGSGAPEPAMAGVGAAASGGGFEEEPF